MSTKSIFKFLLPLFIYACWDGLWAAYGFNTSESGKYDYLMELQGLPREEDGSQMKFIVMYKVRRQITEQYLCKVVKFYILLKFQTNLGSIFLMTFGSGLVFGSYSASIYFAWKVYKHLNGSYHNMSTRTRRLQKGMNRVMITQVRDYRIV